MIKNSKFQEKRIYQNVEIKIVQLDRLKLNSMLKALTAEQIIKASQLISLYSFIVRQTIGIKSYYSPISI
ncbi:hypothetical protein BOH78_3354 [Pichia kudriavzevii]|uniref:Uncharacterized protein n=1 Tax=Pichia kudriavzevii TaxID=4909 RepID=A0A1V2LL36_PICKU|nr:hypothetical protein BOH78_3354 [Pichia kudriavzevii]